MRQFTFKREAKWLFLIYVVPAVVAMLIVLLGPTIAHWLGTR